VASRTRSPAAATESASVTSSRRACQSLGARRLDALGVGLLANARENREAERVEVLRGGLANA